jgi:hypothetical protein
MGECRYSSTILDIGTRWRWVVSLISGLFTPKKIAPRYPLDIFLGGPQSRSGRCGAEKNILLLTTVQSVLRRYADWPTPVLFGLCVVANKSTVYLRRISQAAGYQSHVTPDDSLAVEPNSLLFDSYGYVDMGRPLWRADKSVIYRSHSQRCKRTVALLPIFIFCILLCIMY